MFWLDLKLFGNGHGMAAPAFDQRFYWLSGKLYTFMPGHGAQLHSYQWSHPNAGERRKLAGREYRPFNSVRKGPRVRVAWATKLPVDLDAANAELRMIETHLGKVQ